MSFSKPRAAVCAMLAATIGASVLIPSAAFAHGYVGTEDRDPAKTSLTARAAMKANGDIGAITYEPQSLEAPKGFPAAGPADGQLASAGRADARALDVQTEDRWVKNVVEQGPVTVDWHYKAPHATTKWDYFMTKPGWDPNDQLDRGDFELIQTVEHDGSAASNDPSHELVIPEDREGYHVIYAVWEVADTAASFYNVIDVDVQPGDGEELPADTTPPSLPVPSHDVLSSTSVRVSWTESTDDRGVVAYEVRDVDTQERLARVGGSARSTVVDGFEPGSRRLLYVVAIDAAGNESSYRPFGIDLPEASGVVAPRHLHDMGTTESTVDLMWSASSTEGVEYEVLRDGEVVATTSATHLTDTGLEAGTEYRYQVRAVKDGERSDLSNAHTARTDAAEAPGLSKWDAFAAYSKGDRVIHEGRVYEAVQAHKGFGDPNWIAALSLWAPQS